MSKELSVNIEMKTKLWWKPFLNTIAYLYSSNILNRGIAEEIYNVMIRRAFKFRMDKGEWVKLDIPDRIEFE